MADGGHVDANLVRAAGFQARLDQRTAAQWLEQAPVCDRRAPVRAHGHALSIHRVPADGRLDHARFAHRPHADRPVDALDAVCANLLGQIDVRAVVLGHQ